MLPFAALLADVQADRLGADPVAELTHRTGEWALWALLACLSMTPLRRLLGRPWPLRFRRMLGLYAFFYTSLHLAIYLVLDLGGYWTQIGEDLLKRPFITVGFASWLLMLPLAATSTRTAMRHLGRRWNALHRAVYPAGILAILHFWWQVKADWREPALYGVILLVLLAARVRRGGSARTEQEQRGQRRGKQARGQ
ncbi:sulfoxide reductase heme-binding subunit YedZ [Lysobacter sp. CAU 1642]|uniref:Protein-methionine-sulfoxide reductase heme-binding subunit MsrQ n=1 Tax=Pseudomarimonas salicorniae TaxID=2933270 RepID=A0ABT0GK25_9GAMM|nr:protein-methionine-sulfoxide reductase heme-binding subunit MsrQ [Lysobacter sp. CAU 1642]MCK7594896.1 sulfoxide reductase heme-binding subunit YedZ [Lysobacter sp. CAU 1642]